MSPYYILYANYWSIIDTSMKKTLAALIKAMYTNMNFNSAFIDGLAEELSKTVTEESEADEAVKALEPILKLAKAEADRRATSAVEKAKKGAEPEKKEDAEPEKKEDAGVPEWAKQLISQNELLSDKLAKLESGKTSETRQQALEVKLKDVPPAIKAKIVKDFAKMSFQSDDEFTAYLDETDTDVKDLTQSLATQSLRGQHRPLDAAGTSKEASKEEISSVISNIM